jgi:hypothetical protein
VVLKGNVECERAESNGSLISTGIGEFTALSVTGPGSKVWCKTTFSSKEEAFIAPELGSLPWGHSVEYQSSTKIPLAIGGPVSLIVKFKTSKAECDYEPEVTPIEGKWRNFSEIVTFGTAFVLISGPASCPREGVLEELWFGVSPVLLDIGP